ncbi:dTDP-glucose 4,6-dehydratase [Metabacillus arenae]|uniref:SDR family NAD(P)-dependent oxidoreductase n=1 Tax=Metabacillus arenae TaxID=2771434 RepID=A0A926RYM6_9BACI|nr:SDR family NAD(P)-dependent oxidoreductase [Metabacillus arenae]MBD1381920.1 SDR family NAD(P)-dependent oxidoreductase [Metabacillus arenae]
MKVLVTGGAGFIGRWVVKQLLKDGHHVWVLDDLSNGSKENLDEFLNHKSLMEFVKGDIKDVNLLESLFLNEFDLCYHLGASINVQDSIDNPKTTFDNDTIGTFHVLEKSKKHNVKLVFMSTCMVYDRAASPSGIKETDPVKPASPYAGAKIAAENMVLSYYYAYDLPTVIIRPFNTYGPYQKTGGEGGVVAIFIKNMLDGKPLQIYGDGTQTRDLLYVEDCARFVVQTGYSDQANGEIINAGLGRDISINELAKLIVQDDSRIVHVEHIHPQSEIPKLLCNYEKAKKLLNWEPQVSLEEGMKRTEEWIKTSNYFK